MDVRVLRRATGVVDVVEVEEYLRHVVPAEVYAGSWHMAMLEAQAIAARTYTLHSILHPRHADQGGDLCDGPHCQAMGAATHPRTDAAVAATRDMLWTTGDGAYVSRCGRPDCPLCRGANGHNGQTWTGRMCQWGGEYICTTAVAAKQEPSATWVLARYYCGGALVSRTVLDGVQDERGKTAQGDPATATPPAWALRHATPTLVCIHHSVTTSDHAAIDAIARYHTALPPAGKGEPGAAYHYAVDATGGIYQINDDMLLSWHGHDGNVGIGVCLLGDFTNAPPPEPQLAAAAWLVARLKQRWGITMVIGHREAGRAYTECPGNTWPQWRDRVAGGGT
jgi:hypothetical protein